MCSPSAGGRSEGGRPRRSDMVTAQMHKQHEDTVKSKPAFLSHFTPQK